MRIHQSWSVIPAVPLLFTAATVLAQAGSGPDLTWVEKYVTYAQDEAGALHLTDVHFLAEVAFDQRDELDGVEARLFNGDALVATYSAADKPAFTNGYYYPRKTRSFDSLAKLDQTWPPDTVFRWEIQYPDRVLVMPGIRIGGPELRTQVPAPSPITLSQGGSPVADVRAIDAVQPVTMSWQPFKEGAMLGDSPWSDFIFVLISDCHGEAIFTGGAPGTNENFLTFKDTEVEVPPGILAPGRDYTFFISMVNTVDYNRHEHIEQLSANSFATELAASTAGARDVTDCPEPYRPAVYQWTRKTAPPGAMEAWPTLKDHW